MLSEIEKGILSPVEIEMLYQDRFSRLIKVLGFDTEQSYKMRVIDLKNGFQIEAQYRPTWLKIRVGKGGNAELNFVMRDSGLESIGSMKPSLEIGSAKVQLEPFGIGLEGEMHSVNYKLEQSRDMDVLGIRLAEWLWASVRTRKLRPLDVSVKFPLLPQK